MITNREFGHKGEQLAVSFLQDKGYEIIEQNWQAGKLGEIDIVALFKNEICFIEVKTRQHQGQGWPEQAVTADKIRHLLNAVELYLGQHQNLKFSWHLEVVAIILSGDNQIMDIKHYTDIQV